MKPAAADIKPIPGHPYPEPKAKRIHTAKGRRPYFFDDPDIDKLLAMIMALVGEVSVMRERMDTHERLAQKNEVGDTLGDQRLRTRRDHRGLPCPIARRLHRAHPAHPAHRSGRTRPDQVRRGRNGLRQDHRESLEVIPSHNDG